GLVSDFRVRVVVRLQDVDLGHHGGDVDTGGEGVERYLVFLAHRAHLPPDLPSLSAVDFAHGVLLQALACHDHAADLVTGRHLVVDLGQDVARGRISGGV